MGPSTTISADAPGAVLATGSDVFVGAHGSDELIRASASSGAIQDTLYVGFDIAEMHFTPFGNLLFLVGTGGQVRVVTLHSSMSIIASEDLKVSVTGSSFELQSGSPSEHRVYVASSAGVHTLWIDWSGVIVNAQLTAMGGGAGGVDLFDPFGGSPRYTSHPGSGQLIDRAADMSALGTYPPLHAPTGPLAVSPASQYLVYASADALGIADRHWNAWWGIWHQHRASVWSINDATDIEMAYDPIPMIASPTLVSFATWAGSPTTYQAIELLNDSDIPVTGRRVLVEGAQAAHFEIGLDLCDSSTFGPGESCVVYVRCDPAAGGAKKGASGLQPVSNPFITVASLAGTYTAELVLGIKAMTAPERVPLSCAPAKPSFEVASCAGKCGGPSDGCWCDAACLGFGDCCADKGPMCGD